MGEGSITTTDGRRTDTRDRIRATALEIFSERGWEGATLREIADRLGITRPALYYHFASKEAILDSIHDELARSVDEIIEWAGTQPAGAATRASVLDRLSALLVGQWGPFMHFAQREDDAMRALKGTAAFIKRMNALGDILSPEDTVAGRIRARLALDALFMAGARSERLGGTPTERHDQALLIAKQLTHSLAPR
jgi:AcrR family transcriptional regulator